MLILSLDLWYKVPVHKKNIVADPDPFGSASFCRILIWINPILPELQDNFLTELF